MKKILVVDDDRTTRHVLQKVLAGAGFSTTVAKDGVEALTLVGKKRFDLLLLDVWMPRMNGLDLLARLRPRKAKPRVVIMTSDDAPETLLKAVREQAFRYVHKPVKATALLQTVRETLEAPEDSTSRTSRTPPSAGRPTDRSLTWTSARKKGSGRAASACSW